MAKKKTIRKKTGQKKATRSKTSGKRTTKRRPRRLSGDTVKIECDPLEQGGIAMYLFSMSAKDLWSLVEVNRRSEDKEVGYQRALSTARVRKIAKHIDEGRAIPGAVIVSFDSASVTTRRSRTCLEIPNRPDSGWVIDGQHRISGAWEAETDIDFPCIAFVDLDLSKQIEFFVTINREQKGVSSSLYYDLLRHLPGIKTEKEMVQERANDLVNMLKVDPESPFYQRLVATTSPRSGQLSSTNFIRKVSPLIKSTGRLADYPDSQRAGIINNYYLGLKRTFKQEYHSDSTVFFRTVGFGALIATLPTVLEVTARVAGKNSFRVDHVAKALELIDDFDFDSWRQMGTGSAAEIQAAEEFRTRLTQAAEGEYGDLIEL